MGIFELLTMAVALSMDAFAVAVLKGLALSRIRLRDVFLIALFFGGFQALMPFLGFLLGQRWEQYVVAFDHWIALALLVFIGGKMILESLRDDGEERAPETLRIGELLMLAIATSIDALAVGVTFAFLRVQILSSVALIGVTTFALSATGVAIGRKFGVKMMKTAEIFGGSALILIGVKILLEHLSVL